MRVTIADQFPEAALGELRALGLEVDYRPGIDLSREARAARD